MKTISHFNLPENTNSLYKKEASSSISLTIDVANKINEIIDTLNEFSKTDLEWKQTQEGTIRKGVVYIKDNLMNTLDDMISSLKNAGFFEARLEEYVSDLKIRLDNLIGSVTDDSEVIDGRVGVNGTTYDTLGEAVREQIRDIHQNFNNLYDYITKSAIKSNAVDVPFSVQQNKIIELSGLVTDYTAQTTFYVSEPISVKAGNMYLVTGGSFYNHVIAGFYDKHDNLLSSVTDNNSTTVKVLTNYLMIAPVGASYLRIAYDTRSVTGSVKLVDTLDLTTPETVRSLNTLGNLISEGNEAVELEGEYPLLYKTIDKMLLSVNAEGLTAYDNEIYKVTEPIEVESGSFYKIVASANYGNKFYIMLDSNNAIVPGTRYSQNNLTPQEFNGVVWVPYGVKYIQIAYITTLNEASIQKVVSIKPKGSKNWSNVKWVAFGDSLTEKNARANKSYHDYISEETGINVLNYGVSGTGYARTTDNFYTRVLQLANVDFDIITFFGSGNDLGAGLDLGTASDTGTTTIAGCINQTLDNLFSVKPFATVGIITPTAWNGNTPDIADNQMKAYSDLLIEIAKRRSIPVLDLYRESNLHPESETFRNEFYYENGVQDDGVHPNSKGHKKIASQIREFIAKLI